MYAVSAEVRGLDTVVSLLADAVLQPRLLGKIMPRLLGQVSHCDVSLSILYTLCFPQMKSSR